MEESQDSHPKIIHPEPTRSQNNIIHSGLPPKNHSSFSIPNKKSKFPHDLWDSGNLIYSLKDPSITSQSLNFSKAVLSFDSRFESGNLERAYYLGNDSYHLILEQDPNKSGSCQWFYFRISNIKEEVKYTFNISGFHKYGGVFTSGYKVFVYSEQTTKRSGTSWYRDGANYQFGLTKQTPTAKRYTLQFQIKFNYNNDTVYFAYGIPYTYSHLLRSILSWRKKAPQYFSHEILCKSFGGRDCPLLTITNPSIPESKKQYLMFTARCHPGESNGSVLLSGLIDYFLSPNPESEFLRNNFIIKIVPMINIDGVVEGFYRICLCGDDLNRMWVTPDPAIHPTVFHTKELLRRYKPALYIDFHGHSRMNGTFAFACPNNNENHDREKILPKIISYTSSYFSYEKCIFSIPPKRQTASRCVAYLEMGIIQSFTIETSFCGIKNGKFASLLYDEDIWLKLGRDIGLSIFNLLTPDFSRVRSLAERELKIGQSKEQKPAKGMLSSQSIKITKPFANVTACKSVVLLHNRQTTRQILPSASIPLSVL